MSNRIRSESDFQDAIDEDFAWRLREIAHLKMSVRGGTGIRAKTLIRAGVPLLYAHWEGFVKSATCAYLNFVTHQRITGKKIRQSLFTLSVRTRVHELRSSFQAADNNRSVSTILQCLDEDTTLPFRHGIPTKSNLGAKVFQNILVSLGIDVSPYATRFKFLDESLLEKRNTIAHGSYLDVDVTAYLSLSDDVVTLLRRFKNDLQNDVATASYKAA